jgi:3'(2'), 5'-bisphosphate nucleotidase
MRAEDVAAALDRHLPDVLRWSGAIARQLRSHNIALDNKQTGSAATDALTLADLTVQELIVGALRDTNPIFRDCRILAEESTGDLKRFNDRGELTIAIDPIDGTRQYRDHTGDGYACIVTLQSRETVHYTLVHIPESGPTGSWVRVFNGQAFVGMDDPSQPARAVLDAMSPINAAWKPLTNRVYLIGFRQNQEARAAAVSTTGLVGVPADDCEGCLYELIARGDYIGSLIHTPNVYDFPAGLHLARVLGGDSVWVDNGEPVNFEETWLDEKAKMIRLPRIVATSPIAEVRQKLCDLARDWNPLRYAE